MKGRILFLLAATCVLAASLGADVVIVEEIIAKINGDILLRSEYDATIHELRMQVRNAKDLNEEQKRDVLEKRQKDSLRDLIDRRLMVQRGKEIGMSVEAQVLKQRDEMMEQYKIETVDEWEDWIFEQTGSPAEDMMDRMRESFLSQAVMGQEVGSRIVVARAEIEEYYAEHKEEFIRKEGVQLLELLISTADKSDEELKAVEKRVEELHKRLVRGEPFRELAKRHSENERTAPSGRRYRDLAARRFAQGNRGGRFRPAAWTHHRSAQDAERVFDPESGNEIPRGPSGAVGGAGRDSEPADGAALRARGEEVSDTAARGSVHRNSSRLRRQRGGSGQGHILERSRQAGSNHHDARGGSREEEETALALGHPAPRRRRRQRQGQEEEQERQRSRRLTRKPARVVEARQAESLSELWTGTNTSVCHYPVL